MTELPDHVARNRAAWNEDAADWVQPGRRDWAREEPWWGGVFTVPESELHPLPDDLQSLDAIELGCGTGYVSAWLARRGACPSSGDPYRWIPEAARLLRPGGRLTFLLHTPLAVRCGAEVEEGEVPAGSEL